MPRWSMLVLTTVLATTGCTVAPETILDASALAYAAMQQVCCCDAAFPTTRRSVSVVAP